MALLRMEDGSSMRVLLENEFLQVQEYPSRRVLVVRRTAEPVAGTRAASVYGEAFDLLHDRHRGWGLLVDVRAPNGRNEEEFESAVRLIRARAQALFPRMVVLVRSAVGQLQVNRLGREDGLRAIVTRDADEAMVLAQGTDDASVPPDALT